MGKIPDDVYGELPLSEDEWEIVKAALRVFIDEYDKSMVNPEMAASADKAKAVLARMG